MAGRIKFVLSATIPFFLISVSFINTSLFFYQAEGQSPIRYSTYENEKVRIQFKYPSNWQIENLNFTKNENCDYYCWIVIGVDNHIGKDATVTILPDKLSSNNCFLLCLSQPSLKETMKNMYPKSFIAGYGDAAHILSDNETILNNRHWWQIEYSGTSKNFLRTEDGLEMFTVDDKNIFYEIQYEADKSVYKSHLPEFKDMIKTIAFTDPEISLPPQNETSKQNSSLGEQPSFMK